MRPLRLPAYLNSLLLLTLFCIKLSYAQEDNVNTAMLSGIYPDDPELIHRKESLKAFTMHPYIFRLSQTAPDTTFLNYYRRAFPEGSSLALAYNGNAVGPRLLQTYFDRAKEWNPFVFGNAYKGLLYEADKVLFYDTKSPYSDVSYSRHGAVPQREELFDMTLAINFGKHLNLGGDFAYWFSRGKYIAQRSKAVSYRLFGSLNLDHYELYTWVGNNYFRMTENGGIADDSYITHPEQYASARRNIEAIEIPVRFPSGVGNSHFVGQAHLNHRYNFGKKHYFLVGNTLPNGRPAEQDTSIFVSFASIEHRFEYYKGTRIFVGNNEELSKVYPQHNAYWWERTRKDNEKSALQFEPFDSTRYTKINNTIALSLREGFRPWVKFGLTAYVRLQNQFYFMRDTIPENNGRSRDFSTYIGANISRTGGNGLLQFDVTGEMAPVGHDAGNIRLDGNISTLFKLWKVPVNIKAFGYFHNLKPPLFIEHHRGSYLRWDKDFGFMQKLLLGGVLSAPSWGTSISVSSATLRNTIYFDEDFMPYQHEGIVQILEARLRHKLNWRILNWNLEAAYQMTSNASVIPLPMLSAYASVYLDFYVAKVMRTQLGIDGYFHTRYHAPYYDPATQQFINQKSTSVGNYPLLNIFANFKLRRCRFFLVYYNAAELFLNPSERFSLAHYPVDPAGLRIGISFDFNN